MRLARIWFVLLGMRRCDTVADRWCRGFVPLGLALAAVALAAQLAGAVTPTPTPTPCPLGDTRVHGRVYDARQGVAVPVAGATVHFDQLRRDAETISGDSESGADGGFAFALTLHATDAVVIRAQAAGYAPFTVYYSGDDLCLLVNGAIELPLEPLVREPVELTGIVYDASIDIGAPLADASVHYEYASAYFAAETGTVYTGADGRYQIALHMARSDSTDSLTLLVESGGFASQRADPYPDDLFSDPRIDFGLIPSGGIIAISPAEHALDCNGAFTVTIANAGGPEQGVLVITAIDLHHEYSHGDNGSGFSWDLSGIALPASLTAGQQLRFALVYRYDGWFSSRLHLSVASGAHNREEGVGLYRGDISGCGSPTPTPTPATCAGDCNRDGQVRVDELVLGVLIAQESRPLADCAAMHAGDEGPVTIADLVAAVGSALNGCTQNDGGISLGVGRGA